VTSRRIDITLSQKEINAAVGALIERKLRGAGVDVSGNPASVPLETYFMCLVDPPAVSGATMDHRAHRDGHVTLVYTFAEFAPRAVERREVCP
jgi:hypothetical protein